MRSQRSHMGTYVKLREEVWKSKTEFRLLFYMSNDLFRLNLKEFHQRILPLGGKRLMRKDDVWSWRIRSTSWQTFMRRKWCTMPLPTESTPAPSLWTPLPLPTRRMPKVHLIIHRLSPMTATRHGLQMSYLNDRGVDHRCLLHYESIKPHCAIGMASYCEMKYRKKLSEGTVWRAQSHDQKALWDEIGLSQT